MKLALVKFGSDYSHFHVRQPAHDSLISVFVVFKKVATRDHSKEKKKGKTDLSCRLWFLPAEKDVSDTGKGKASRSYGGVSDRIRRESRDREIRSKLRSKQARLPTLPNHRRFLCSCSLCLLP